MVIFLQTTSEKYPDGISKRINHKEKAHWIINISCILRPLSLKNKVIIGIDTKNHRIALIKNNFQMLDSIPVSKNILYNIAKNR